MALGRQANAEGDYKSAQTAFAESWELLRTTGAKEHSVSCLEGYGEVLALQNEPVRAVQLWATAATVRAAIIAPMPPVYRVSYRQALALARQQLSEETFQSAWAEGHNSTLDAVQLT